MSEKPSPIPVNAAFDPVERQAQKELDVYAEGRPYEDSMGNAHDPVGGQFINSDEYFNSRRKDIRAEGQTPYESMPTTVLARKLGEAEFNEDRTTATNIEEAMLDKAAAQDEKERERDPGRDDKESDNLLDHLTATKESELQKRIEENIVTDDEGAAAEKERATDTNDDTETETKTEEMPTIKIEGSDKPSSESDGSSQNGAESTEEDFTYHGGPIWGGESPIDRLGGLAGAARSKTAMASAAKKLRALRELPTKAFVKGQSKLSETQEFYDDEERGQRRRRITAAVIGVVGLAGISYLANKGVDTSGSGVTHHAGDISQANQHTPGFETQPLFPGIQNAQQHAHEAAHALGDGGTTAPAAHTIELKPGQNPWEVSEHRLHDLGVAHPTDAQIEDYDKLMAHANPDVYAYGGDSSENLAAGTKLKLPR